MQRPANPKSEIRNPKSRRGFTLVELMVVLAVIIILMALLLPTIAGVRARARQGQCATYQHQIWEGLAKANEKLKPATVVPTSWPDSVKGGLEGETRIFLCPDDMTPSTSPGSVKASYGMNNKAFRLDATADVGKIVLLDYKTLQANVVGRATVQDVINEWNGNVAPRHFQAVNITQADGHTSAIDPSLINPAVCPYYSQYWLPAKDAIKYPLTGCIALGSPIPPSTTTTGGSTTGASTSTTTTGPTTSTTTGAGSTSASTSSTTTTTTTTGASATSTGVTSSTTGATTTSTTTTTTTTTTTGGACCHPGEDNPLVFYLERSVASNIHCPYAGKFFIPFKLASVWAAAGGNLCGYPTDSCGTCSGSEASRKAVTLVQNNCGYTEYWIEDAPGFPGTPADWKITFTQNADNTVTVCVMYYGSSGGTTLKAYDGTGGDLQGDFTNHDPAMFSGNNTFFTGPTSPGRCFTYSAGTICH